MKYMIKNKKRVLKSFLLTLLTAFSPFIVYGSTHTIDIVLTVGKRYEIDPADYGFNRKTYRCCSLDRLTGAQNLLYEGISVDNIVNGIHYAYAYMAITPLQKGNYILTYSVSNYKSYNYSVGETVTFNIKAVDVVSISIPSTLSLTCGDSFTFTPVVIDSEAETTLTWSTSDASVASVADGTVTALKEGTAIITCISDNGISAQCEVTVGPRIITDITLNYAEYELEQNQTLQLETMVLPADAPNQKVTWSSTNTSVAIVSANGKVVALSEGWASITATTTDGSNLNASCLVHVIPPKVLATSLTLDATELELTQGDNAMLTATLQPSNVSSSTLVWTSSDENIVKVDEAGNVVALQIGRAIISASTADGSGLTATCDVKVKSKSVSEFDNVVYFNNATALKNSETILPLHLKNRDEITAIQFDLVLPEGMNIALNTNGTAYGITFEEERADATTHTLNSAQQENGTVRVLCYSTASEIFLGNEGAVLYFPIMVSDLNRGTYNLILQDIVITDKVGNKTNIETIGSVLNVVEAIPGDANGDNEIDVADIVAVANHILGSSANDFLATSADYDSDGTVDVADIVNIANHILGGNTADAIALARSVLLTRGAAIGYSLEVLPFVLEEEGSKTVTLDLYNPNVEFTAFQCDLHLPEGLTVDLNRRGTAYNFSFNADADRTDATYHTLSSAKQTDGAIRVLCYSTANEIFLGEEGALLNIPLTADASLASGVYEFSIANTVLTYANGVKVEPEAYKGSIVVGDGGEVKEMKLYGNYTSDVLDEYTAAFGENREITSIDLTEAVNIDGERTLTTGNPNTIVYLAEGAALANASNVVCGDECVDLVLTDGYAFDVPVEFTALKAIYTRELASGKYGTIVLPFAPNTDYYEFYELVSVGDNTLIFDEVVAPVANTPYLYKLRDGKTATRITANDATVSSEVTPTGTADWQMVGSFTNQTIAASEAADKYYYAYTSSDNKIHQVTNVLTVNPYRAYFTTSSTDGVQLAVRTRGGEETLIDVSEVDALLPEVYYDLSGRRIDNPVRDIYIVNGKKVLVR